MLIPFTLPPPVRVFLHDGLRLLVARLAALTQEFRAGLIAAIGRTLADGVEHVMERVIPHGGTSRVRASEYQEDDFDVPRTDFTGSHPEFQSSRKFSEIPQSENRTPMPMTRALIATCLNAFGILLLRIGFVPTSAIVAMLGGVLMFRQSN